MITFRMLWEAPTLLEPEDHPRKESLLRHDREASLPDGGGSRMGSLMGHDVVRVDGEGSTVFHAVRGGHPRLSVTFHDTPFGRNQVVHLSSSASNTLGAHHLYHHLVTQHGMEITSGNEQSRGGMRVWERLHAMPGVRVTVRSPDGGEVPPETPWEGNYAKMDGEGNVSDTPRAHRVFVARKA